MAADPANSWTFGSAIPAGTPESLQRKNTPTGLESLRSCYQIVGELGRGGMGVVYHARDAAGRDLALKVLSGRLNPSTRERFRREAEFTASLRHPGIVRIHGGGEAGGVPFIAYELIAGGRTLEEAAADLDREARLRLLADVAHALGHAHAHGMVHRDVKPMNVLVDAEGHPHLADFGLAWTGQADRLTQTGAFVGTPAYMAPEQFHGDGEEPEPTADVWSVGVMLYEQLSDGKLPFVGSSLLELAARIRVGEYEPLSSHDASLPRDLVAVCTKALQRDPADRYSDGAALAADLENALAGRPVDAAPPSSIVRFLRHKKRQTGLGIAVVGLLLPLGFGVRQLWIGAQRNRISELTKQVRRSGQGRAELERALASGAGVGKATLAEGHLALASGEATSAEAWRQRLAHALAAVELAEEGKARVDALSEQARLHSLLGDEQAAAEALRRACPRGTVSPVLLTRLARALLAASELEEAGETARAVVSLRGTNEDHSLLFDVQVTARELEAAEGTLAWIQPGPTKQLAKARLVRARGDSPLELLEQAVKEWSTEPQPRRELVLYLLETQQLHAARQVLAQAPGRTPATDLLRLLDALLPQPDPKALSRLSPALQRRAATILLRDVERELAAAEHLDDPRYQFTTRVQAPERRERARRSLGIALGLNLDPSLRPHAAVLQARACEDASSRSPYVIEGLRLEPSHPALLRMRAEERLAAGRPTEALAALEAIVSSPAPEEAERIALLRGRSLLELERTAEALTVLEAIDRDMAPACRLLARALRASNRGAEAAALEKRADALEHPDSEAASAALDDLKRGKLLRGARHAQVAAQIARYVTPLDPLNYPARTEIQLSKILDQDAPTRREGLWECAETILRCPKRLGAVTTLIFVCSSANPLRDLVGKGRSLDDLLSVLPAEAHALRGFIRTGKVEYENEPTSVLPSMAEVNVALRNRPDSVMAYTLRGFLNVRLGRLEQAEWDLATAHELSNDCGTVAFYRSLLAGAQRAPVAQVGELLQEADRQGHKSFDQDGFSLTIYPELAGYDLDSAAHFKKKRARRVR